MSPQYSHLSSRFPHATHISIPHSFLLVSPTSSISHPAFSLIRLPSHLSSHPCPSSLSPRPFRLISLHPWPLFFSLHSSPNRSPLTPSPSLLSRYLILLSLSSPHVSESSCMDSIMRVSSRDISKMLDELGGGGGVGWREVKVKIPACISWWNQKTGILDRLEGNPSNLLNRGEDGKLKTQVQN